MRPIALLTSLLALPLLSCTGDTTIYAQCQPDPKVAGDVTFVRAEGRRLDSRDVALEFTLKVTRDERLSRTPDVRTSLGEVVFMRVGGASLDMTLRLTRPGAARGSITLTGTTTADYRNLGDPTQSQDRCAYVQTFNLEVTDTSVTVEQALGDT